METDVYYEYEVAKGRVNFLYEMEDSDVTWEDYKSFLGKYNLQPFQPDLEDWKSKNSNNFPSC